MERWEDMYKMIDNMFAEIMRKENEEIDTKYPLDRLCRKNIPDSLKFEASYTTEEPEEPEEGCGCDCDDEDYTISELLEMLWDKMADEGFVSLSKNLDGDIIHVEIKEESI